MYNEYLVSTVVLLISLSEISEMVDSDECSTKHNKVPEVYYMDEWLGTGPKNSNDGRDAMQCRPHGFVDQSKIRQVSPKSSKASMQKTSKKIKGSKRKRKKEKRKKQVKLKKERQMKKISKGAKSKHIKDTHD